MEDEWPGLRPAEPAVERNQLLEGAALFQLRVVKAVHEDVRRVREAVGAHEVASCIRAERLEWIVALDYALCEVVRTVRAQRDGPVRRRVHQGEADVLVFAQRRQQERMPLLDLLEREPPRFVRQ